VRSRTDSHSNPSRSIDWHFVPGGDESMKPGVAGVLFSFCGEKLAVAVRLPDFALCPLWLLELAGPLPLLG
jgi:hypothetical protein